jgi:hypothetical protein
MGYYIHTEDGAYTIPADKRKDALKALDNYREHQDVDWGDDRPEGGFKTLREALNACRFSGEEEEEGGDFNVNCFTGEKYSSDLEKTLNVIAPFCEEGDYMQFQGEEGEHWRWIVQNGKIKEVYAELVWK